MDLDDLNSFRGNLHALRPNTWFQLLIEVEGEVAGHAGYDVCHLPSSYGFDVELYTEADAVVEREGGGWYSAALGHCGVAAGGTG